MDNKNLGSFKLKLINILINNMDTQGGGLTHYQLGNVQNVRLVYGDGLRAHKPNLAKFEESAYFYEKKSFVRGYIFHHRSNATQQWFFHHLYGGFTNFYLKRYVVDNWVKKWGRIAFLPFTLHLFGACIGQREYDNNAYDYFYFSY